MFDLLRDAYLIPQTFHGKAGENPVLLTSPSGDLLEGKDVSHHTMRRFKKYPFTTSACSPFPCLSG